jgi:Domain of unknown function (DUF1918)
MRARVGSRLLVESRHVGGVRREGVILEVIPGRNDEHYRVRWTSGEESIFFPESDCRITDPTTPDAGDIDLRRGEPQRPRPDTQAEAAETTS